MSFHILVVDDFQPWRQQICSMLQTRHELRVIAEAEDGLEAVQKAGELKPDLILLDINLPSLNGIEAALKIREASPDARIIFLSHINDDDVMKEALGTGAAGYVLKVRASQELLPAMKAALRNVTTPMPPPTEHQTDLS
jgi:two-component system, NarL family, response regulator NreC